MYKFEDNVTTFITNYRLHIAKLQVLSKVIQATGVLSDNILKKYIEVSDYITGAIFSIEIILGIRNHLQFLFMPGVDDLPEFQLLLNNIKKGILVAGVKNVIFERNILTVYIRTIKVIPTRFIYLDCSF